MSDTRVTIGSKISNAPARAPATTTEPQKQEATTTTAVTQMQPISPTMKSDPIAGVMITQYLNSKGEVQVQLPSAAAIAYLRVGLTAAGERPKREEVFADDTMKNLLA